MLLNGVICNNNKEYFNEVMHKLISMLYPKICNVQFLLEHNSQFTIFNARDMKQVELLESIKSKQFSNQVGSRSLLGNTLVEIMLEICDNALFLF